MKKNLKMFIACGVLLAALPLMADTETVGGYTWTYRINGNTAEIYGNWYPSPAISPKPTGAVTIPSTLGGKPVTSIGGWAFEECSGLTSVTIPNSVTSIGDYAFYNCSGLTSVTIPDSVTGIGQDAFSGCSRLTSVTIPDSVTSIGSSAFSLCSGLTSVTIPDSVTSIGQYAFDGCSGLTSVTIPDSVTSIWDAAFWGCSGLTSVTIPNSVTSIGASAFWGCGGLTSVTIPDSVTSIGEYAFRGCGGLTSVTIPDSVTNIGSSAFSGCRGLTSVTIGNDVTSIGEYAFSYCSGLTSVTIGNGVTSIGQYAFSGCSGLTSVTIPDSVTSIGEYAFSGCGDSLFDTTSIPGVKLVDGWAVGNTGSLSDNLDLTGVRGIAPNAFRYCSGLTSVTIPDSVTSIGDGAFYGCSGLTDVHISDLAKWCGISFDGSCANPLDYAHNLYLNGEKVADLVIPGGVTSIGNYAFNGCSGLTSVTIPDGVTSIGSSAFDGCIGLTSVTIPGSVERIGVEAFSNCGSLTSVIILDSVTIGDRAFSNCSALKFVRFPLNGTVSNPYNPNCFSGCESIEIVEMPGRYPISQLFPSSGSSIKTVIICDGETDIVDGAFYGCTSLARVVIPSSVTNIGNYAFANCSKLTELMIPASIKHFGTGVFSSCSSLTSLGLSDGLTSIGNQMFSGCGSLISVTIPNTVTNIGSYAFSGCNKLTMFTVDSLYFASYDRMVLTKDGTKLIYVLPAATEVAIPEGVTNVAVSAFTDCSKLRKVRIPNTLTSIGNGLFSNCTSLEEFVVADDHPKYRTYNGRLISKDDGRVIITPRGITSMEIKEGVEIQTSALDGYANLSNIVVAETDPNYKFEGGILLSKSGNSIVAIPKGATSITIPDFVTTLDGTFLAKCRLLEELSIPTNVTYISTDAFNACPSLRRINLAAGSPIVFTDEYFTSNIGLEINVTGATSKTLPTPEVVNITGATNPNTGEPMVLNFESIWNGSDFVLSDVCDPYGTWHDWSNSEDGWRLYSFLFMQDGYYYSSGESSDRVASIFNVRDDDGNLLEYGKDWYLVRTSGKYFTETYGYYTYNGGEGYGDHYIYNVDFAIVGCGEYSGSFNFSAKARCRREQPWYGMAFLSDGVEMARRNYYYSYPDGNEEWNCDSYNYYQKFGTNPEIDPFGYQIFGEYGYSNELQIVTYSGTPRIEAIYNLGNRDEYGSWRQCIENVDYMCVSSEPNTSSGSGEITTSVIFKNAGSYEIQLVFPASPVNADYYYVPMWFEEKWETVHVSIAPQPTDKLPMSGKLSMVYTGEEIRPTDEWGLWSSECSRLYCDTSLVVTNAGTYHVGIGVEYNYASSTYAHPNIDGDWIGLEPWPWNEFMDSQDMPVNYTGLTSVAFTVLPRPVVAGQMSCSLPDDAVFDGNAKVLSNIAITNDYNGTVLQEGVDYDVSYSDNSNPGLATATITCKGNYSGTFTKTFMIVPASFDLTGSGGTSGYSGGAGSVSGYEGEYDGEGHGLAIDVSAHGDVTVKYALTENEPYIDQLLFTNVCDETVWFELGALGYNSFTGFVQVAISPRSITNATIAAENIVEAAGGIPQLSYSVTDAALDKMLTEGVDYTAVVENDEAKGVTTISLTGIGNYDGETQTTTLLQRSIADFGFELSQTEYFYDATQKRPTVTVTDSATHGMLEAGRDYIVAYYDNTRVGTARVVVTGIGAYTGRKTLTFSINYRRSEQNGIAWQYWARDGEAKLVGFAPVDEGAMPSVVVIPDEIDGLPVAEIPDGFLRGCSTIETVVAGANVTKFGNGVFRGCTSLKYVVFAGKAPRVNQYWTGGDFEGETFISVFTGAPKGVKVVAAKRDGGWGESWPSGEESRLVVYAPAVSITPFSGKKSGRLAVTIINDGDISGAEVRYTTDGTEPTAASALYERRFTINVTELVSVKAAVFLGGVRVSDVAETRYSPVLNDVLDIGNIVAKPGSAPLFFDLDSRNQWWSDEDETSFDGTPSMKSGKIGNEGESWMSASFTGAGVLEFNWKTSCEYDDYGEFYFDHAICELDGVEVAWLDGVTDGWIREEIQVATTGEHAVKWIYVKDDADDKVYPGEDCVWVDGVKFSYPVYVSFSAGDGSGDAPESIMSSIGYAVVLPGQGSLTYAKHEFIGWSDGETIYAEGSEYVVGASDTTLNAVWREKMLAAPVIAVASVYDEESTVVSINVTDGTSVYYTTDGSAPDAECGTLYVAPFMVTGTTTIKAVAMADDWFASAISETTTTRSWSSLEECLGTEEFSLATGGGANWIGDSTEGCVKTAALGGGWLTATFYGPGVATYLLREGFGEWARHDEVFPDDGVHVLRWEGEALAVKGLELLPVVSVSFAVGEDVEGMPPQTVFTAEGREIAIPGGEGLFRAKHMFAGWSDGKRTFVEGEGYLVGADDMEFAAAWTAKTLIPPVIDAPSSYEADSVMVSISSEVGTVIHYTVDGSIPTEESAIYEAPFEMSGSFVVKAIAAREDYFASSMAECAVTRPPWMFGECLNAPKLEFTTSEDAAWFRVKGVSQDGYALRSATNLGNRQSSVLSTTVDGAGVIMFMCKVSSEADDDTGEAYDGLVFSVDGIDATDIIGGEIGWTNLIFKVEGDGPHTLSWRYEKDKRDSAGEDCAWVDGVTWMSGSVDDPIPPVASDDDVAAALTGTADANVAANVANAAQYAAYRTWALSVTNGTTTAQMIKESDKTWLSFALGANALIGKEIASNDVRIVAFEAADMDSGAMGSSRPTFAFEVAIDNVNIGGGSVAIETLKENLKKVLGIEGAATLSPDGFSSENVDLEIGTPKDGKATFTAKPKDAAKGDGGAFFMRVRVNQ